MSQETMGLILANKEIIALQEEIARLRAENDRLRDSNKKLVALEVAGVDNWSGYDVAMERFYDG